MKRYLLLRKNQETGPYTLEELTVKKLRPLDLIWEEGESTCWKYADEIGELKHLVEDEPEDRSLTMPEVRTRPRTNAGHCYVDPFLSHATNTYDLQKKQAAIARQFREKYRKPGKQKNLWKRQTMEQRSLSNLALVFVGVVLGSFVMKKLVDNMDDTSMLGSTEASFVFSHPQVPKVSDPNIQNAISREFIPVKDTSKKTEVKTVRPKDLRKLVKVNGSEYKVGILGGISNLEINVYNGSEQLVDRVTVEVRYQNADGQVVDIRNFTAHLIKPFHTRTISIPANERGVKVQYKILNISANGAKRFLKEA